MILVFFFVSILTSLPFLHSAAYHNTSMPNCPESFNCPDFGPFKYPFYKATDTHCRGLIKVDCTTNHENVQIGEHSFEITAKFGSGSSVVIRNRTFAELVGNKSCEALMNNFTSPTPNLFNISIYPIANLFKCRKDSDSTADIDHYFPQPTYYRHNSCKDYNFYYTHPLGNTTVPSDLPPTCEVIQLPAMVNMTQGYQAPDYNNIFSLLTPMFNIFFMSPSCDKCLTKHSNCKDDWNFQCSDDKNDNHVRKLIMILVLAGSAFILVLSSVIFIIKRYYDRNPFPYVSSKDETSDLEDTSFFYGVPVFSYTELKDATRNFDPSQELGDGGFGAVYYGKLQDGREVAVKRLHEHNYKRVQHFMNEVEILTKLRHPNLVTLYGCTSRQSHALLLVYEYIPNGTVADHLHGKRANPSLLTWPIRMNIATETASALAYLHATEIIHRDVKTNNILLDHNFCVKVADFGLSRPLPNDVTHVSTAPQGTPGYLDPQYYQCYQLTDKSDVYSFGVVLIELISSMVAVDLSRSQDEISLANLAINRIQRCALDQLIDPVLGSDMNAEYMRMITSVAELAFRCLQFDSEMRPTMNEVLDVLEDIQSEGRSISEFKTVKAPPPSENIDAVVLLKDFMCSPVSVVGEWQSDNSGSTTLIISGNTLPMKNSISN